MKTFKVLGALLDYPSEELIAALPELEQALDEEQLLTQHARDRLAPLFAELESADLMSLQERYVDLFDRVRSLSLHLFEHVHGESRDRGQALVDLKQVYERHGLALAAQELPDFLPAFLEFLSSIEAREASGMLAETGAILEGIGARLGKRGSAYAAVFEVLLGLAGHAMPKTDTISDEDIRKEDDPASLDAQWQEEPAFGPAPACGAAARPGISVVQFHKRAVA